MDFFCIFVRIEHALANGTYQNDGDRTYSRTYVETTSLVPGLLETGRRPR